MDRSTKPSFNFINLKHPDDLKDEETQLRIRRLAMTEVGKARRRPKTKRERNEFILEFRKPMEKKLAIDRLGSGKIDPFSHYPIELDDSDRLLLANIFSQDTNHPSQLRDSWYPVGLSSASSFHNILANSQNFLFQKQNGYFPSQDYSVALAHHHKSLLLAGRMMKDPTKHTSDEFLGVVISFMCHLALLSSFSSGEWEKHRSALVRIVALRGGYDKISVDHFRIISVWVDLIGCFAQDIAPVVPMPRQWEADAKSPHQSPRPRSPISLAWKQRLPMQTEWISIFEDTVQLISLDCAFSVNQLVLAQTTGSWIEPTMYRLLTLRPLELGKGPERIMEEVCRLGTILFLAPFWRILGHSPIWTAAISRNLIITLLGNMVEWHELKPLLIWVLYFAAVETKDLAERGNFVFMLGVLMSGLQLQDWDDMMRIVKGVLWVEKVYAGSDDLIRDEVMHVVKQGFQNTIAQDDLPTLPPGYPDELEEH